MSGIIGELWLYTLLGAAVLLGLAQWRYWHEQGAESRKTDDEN